ncbi:MAG TPA: hypothetical protein VGE69_01840 [Pseudomonadales bacterium]
MKPSPLARPRTSVRLFLLAFSVVGCGPLGAQQTIPVAELLFEPVALGDTATERPLVPYAQVAAAWPVQYGLSSEQRATLEAELAGLAQGTTGADLLAAGSLQQRLGDHDAALETLTRALAAPGADEPAVRAAIAESHRALGKEDEADAMIEAAFALQQEQHGENSVDLVPALRQLGDWNTQAFLDRSSIARNVKHANTQQMMMEPRSVLGTEAETTRTPLYKLYEARRNYLTAIGALAEKQNYTHPDLLPLERALLTNYFLQTHNVNIVYEPDFYMTRRQQKTGSRLDQSSIELASAENYDLGRQAHQRITAYIYNDENGTYRQLADAMLQEADWDLLYEHKPEAKERYDTAYKFFNESPELVAELQDLLYPDVPTVLPVFMPAPNSRAKLGIPADAPPSFFGYIDVSFEIAKDGKTKKVRVLDKGGEIDEDIELRLKEYLRNLTFRPRYDGAELDTDAMRVRYYVGA